MKILQINSHYNQGGAAKMVACIHKQLLAEGEESYVVYGRGQQPKEENVYRIDNDAEVYFSALMSRLLGLNGWGNWIATGRLIKLIRQIQPDVIHMHALHGYYLNFGRLFKYLKNAGIPCVWTMHDCHAFVGNCGYFFECRKWENGCQHCQNIRNYPTSQFFDLTRYMWKKKREWFTWCERMVITTPSHWMTAEVRKSFLGKYTCRTMRNGIDTEGTFYPRNREQCRRKYGFAETDKLVLGIAVDYDDPRKE